MNAPHCTGSQNQRPSYERTWDEKVPNQLFTFIPICKFPHRAVDLTRIFIKKPVSHCSQTELAKYTPIAKSSSDQQPFIHHSDSTKTNTTDVSECSTNTEDYITCNDASKRGTKPPSASSSSTTQVPGSNSEHHMFDTWIRCWLFWCVVHYSISICVVAMACCLSSLFNCFRF